MWEGNKKIVFITFPHDITCQEVVKIFVSRMSWCVDTHTHMCVCVLLACVCFWCVCVWCVCVCVCDVIKIFVCVTFVCVCVHTYKCNDHFLEYRLVYERTLKFYVVGVCARR